MNKYDAWLKPYLQEVKKHKAPTSSTTTAREEWWGEYQQEADIDMRQRIKDFKNDCGRTF